VAHIEIVGENLLAEKQKDIQKVLLPRFSKCRLSVAVPKEVDYTRLAQRKKSQPLIQ